MIIQKDKILDDIAQLAGGTASVVSGLGQSIKSDVKSRVEEIVDRLDLVPREDFDRLEAVLIETRARCDALEKRVATLEGAKPKTKKAKSA
ncbi:MAG: accessory factor UbiK family protein [Bdellovibrionales bacterium]